MSKISKIIAREILDSRGDPTVECRIILDSGVTAKASVPSGASTGRHEAYELRDGDKRRYHGKGVLKAVYNVNTKLAQALIGKNNLTQIDADHIMIDLDGSENKRNLGANAILAVSLAYARVMARQEERELYDYLRLIFGFNSDLKMPAPSFNIFNGGKHADTNLDFQEFMILPLRQTTFAEKVRMGAEIFHELGHVIREAGYDTDVGNEGGYAPDIVSSVQAIEFILAAIINAGYQPGKDIGLGIDVGSSGLYDPAAKKYIFKLDRANFTNRDLVGLYLEWFRKYPLISIEDGLAEDDWTGWRELTDALGRELLLIGDDLFTTNVKRLRQGLKDNVANAVLIKPNQVGTLTETVDCIKLAQKHNYKIMISHRSGETGDDFIADLAVAAGAEYIKSGSLSAENGWRSIIG